MGKGNTCVFGDYEGIKECLFNQFVELGTYDGAWTSGRIRRQQ